MLNFAVLGCGRIGRKRAANNDTHPRYTLARIG